MDQINAKEMEKIVKEAGLYEEGLSREEVRKYYEVIANSKTTAKTEDESREFNESQSDDFEEVIPSISKLPSKVNSKRNSVDERNNVEVLDACKANITFKDMQSAPKEKYLEVKYHPLKYVNIQNSKKFLEASDEIKAKMLYSYFTKQQELRSQLSRQSFFPVPVPKPFNIRETYMSSLLLDSEVEDTYVSRSGRQTKRRIYIEDEDSNSGAACTKKQKNLEVEWNSKEKPLRGATSKGSEALSVTTKTTHNSDSHMMSSSSSTPNRIKRFLNSDIMEKSTLFEDSPKTGTSLNTKTEETFLKSYPKSKKKLTRSEEMFANLINNSGKKQKEDAAMDAFEKTLKELDEEEQQNKKSEIEDIIDIMDDEPGRRRIVPPVPVMKRRNIHSTSQSPRQLIETADLHKKKGRAAKSEPTRSSIDSVSKKNEQSDGVACPVCNNKFPEKKIEEHAANCGEEEREEPLISKFTRRHESLMCNVCDKVYVEGYEEHVLECIRKKRLSDRI